MWNWYSLFSLTDFLATGLVSRTLTVALEGIGDTDILITQGNMTSILYEDSFLPIEFNDENPYVRGSVAVYLDEENQVWLGIEEEEE